MRRFAQLFTAIDATTSTNAKVAAMAAYFQEAPPEDAAWALYFLAGERPKRLLSSRLLAQWAIAEAKIEPWLFEESYRVVGDLAETIALLIAAGRTTDDSATDTDHNLPLSRWMADRILALRGMDVSQQRNHITSWWRSLDTTGVFILNKLITGAFRVGVSRTLVVRALAQAGEAPAETVAHRLMGSWQPTAAFMRHVLAAHAPSDDHSRPYPFFLASPLEADPAILGPITDWQLEWKWDGIRAQLIRRAGETHLWSRGEDLLTDRFPEVTEAAARLPDGVVLDGELLAFSGGKPLPFAKLQRRIGRKEITRRVLRDAPVVFIAYDLLELDGEDIRTSTLRTRRAHLEEVITDLNSPRLLTSALITADSWPAAAKLRNESRDRAVEGLMLKRLDSPYAVGRTKGDWWKWKVDPYTFDGVMVYAEPGHGRRANLLTDYTFAVWSDDRGGRELVPVARAYSGLDQSEIAELDSWIRRNSTERFGPVRAVSPTQVFEIAFEGIAASDRHKGGVALRFPRIARWRKDKPAAEADTLASLRGLIHGPPPQATLFDNL